MKNQKPFISMALICALSSFTALAGEENKPSCNWKEIAAADVQSKLKSKLEFSKTKITSTIEIPEGSKDRFVMNEPKIIRGEKSDRSETETSEDLKSKASKVGISISFCSTESEPSLESFLNAHKSEKKVSEIFEVDAISEGESALAGYSEGEEVILAKSEVKSAHLSKLLRLEKDFCVNCEIASNDVQKIKNDMAMLSGIDSKFAKDAIFKLKQKELELLSEEANAATDIKELNAILRKIMSQVASIKTLKIDNESRTALYEELRGMLDTLSNTANQDAFNSGDKASQYADLFKSLAASHKSLPGTSKSHQAEYETIRKSFDKNGEGRKALVEGAKEKTLIDKAETREKELLAKVDPNSAQSHCKMSPMDIAKRAPLPPMCIIAQRNLAEFRNENWEHLPKIKAQVLQAQSKSQGQQTTQQDSFLAQYLLPNGAPAIPKANEQHGPDYFASLKPNPNAAPNGIPVFNEGAPAAMIPNNNYGYDVNKVYQQEGASAQIGSQDYISFLISAQKQS